MILFKESISYFQLPIKIEHNGCIAFIVFTLFLVVAVYLLVVKTKTNVPKDIKDKW